MLAAFVVTAVIAFAPAVDPSAEDAWARADELAAAGDHVGAAAAYAEAHAAIGAPAILYSWAQSERLRGDCSAAIGLYDRFLAVGVEPPPSYASEALRGTWAEMRANAAAKRAACQATLARVPVPRVVPVDPPRDQPRASPPARPPSPAVRSPGRWRRDPLGWSLVAIGGAAAIAGGTTMGVASATDHGADGLATHDAFRDAIARARLEQQIGVAVLATGGALLVGGMVRLLLLRRRQHRDDDVRGARGILVPRWIATTSRPWSAR